MNHYVLIDIHSGFVWYETEAESATEAARLADLELSGEKNNYIECDIAGIFATYSAYIAPTDWAPVDDGQIQAEINRVESQCHFDTLVTKEDE